MTYGHATQLAAVQEGGELAEITEAEIGDAFALALADVIAAVDAAQETYNVWIAMVARPAAERRRGVPAGDMAVVDDPRYCAALEIAGQLNRLRLDAEVISHRRTDTAAAGAFRTALEAEWKRAYPNQTLPHFVRISLHGGQSWAELRDSLVLAFDDISAKRGDGRFAGAIVPSVTTLRRWYR